MAQINKPNLHFNPRLYTGTGSALSVTGVGFQPDLVWLKDRDSSGWHFWTDAVRGVTKTIFSNTNNAEGTETGGLTAFGTDGYSVGTHSNINTNGNDIVSMNWKAANSAGSSNSDGTITSTVSANTTAGFSIVKWTNGTSNVQTIGHGLGVAPKFIIMKVLSSTGSWNTYHESIGNTHGLYLNSTAAKEDNVAFFNDTSPTSTVFTTGTNGNLVNNTLVAYCFAEKKGFSKFGSYTGNGDVDGPFIYLGFKPAFVIIKQVNTTNHWYMWDNKRDPDNPTNLYSRPDTTDVEGSYDWLDLVSNGIKIRNTSSGASTNGGTYIYMAWAENPIVGSNNIPATAR
tara:strand:+ start:870 stop:1892 length:1023 start_codon:yes stop_codon:yes gene_type:complete